MLGDIFRRFKNKKRRPPPPDRESAVHGVEDTGCTGPTSFSHYPQARNDCELPLIAHNNHFLGDVFDSTDSTVPISCGFYHLKPGVPLEYAYTYHEMKIILEGEVRVRDGSGQEILARAGDVFYFPKGSLITFSTETPTGVKAFFCGQRARGAA